jgi:uncharacterized protein YbjT (DUF2867 family)
MKVLATGATGDYAGLVAPALVDHGIEVRAMVHDPAKADIARAHARRRPCRPTWPTQRALTAPSTASTACSSLRRRSTRKRRSAD